MHTTQIPSNKSNITIIIVSYTNKNIPNQAHSRQQMHKQVLTTAHMNFMEQHS